MRYSEKENFNRVVTWNNPSHVCINPSSRGASYAGAWPSDSRPSPDTMAWHDIWGARWEDKDGEVFPYGGAVDSYEKIDALVPPDPHAEGRMQPMEALVAELDREACFLCVNHPYLFYEKAINVLPPAEFLMSLAAAPDKAHRLLDMFLEFELGIAEDYARYQPDHVNLSDDYGIQDRLSISPDMWREFFKPRLKRMIDFYRRNVGEHVTISLHSCGHVMPILEDIVEIGFDIINPIQTTANDLSRMREITSHTLCLAGGIDGQRILPFGTPDDVRAEVFTKMDMLWEGGGYLPFAEKRLGVPKENLEAMTQAIRDWSQANVED